MQKVSAVILDLGGVLLNIDYSLTRKAFADLGIANFDAYYNQFKGSPLFEDLETGRVSRHAFFAALRERSGLDLSDQQITDAWNAMLLDFPPERVSFLSDLRGRYKLFLLSNTNAIHYDSFQQHFREVTGLSSLDDLFDKAYYSHILGARKPDSDPFQMILDEQGLIAGETLFVDDTESNLAGARELGMQTIHLHPPLKVEALGL